MKNFSVTTALVTLVALYGFGTSAFAADPVSDKPAAMAAKSATVSTGAKKVKAGDVKSGNHKPQMKHPAVKEGVSHAKATFEKHMATRGPRISVNGIVDSRYSFKSDKAVYDVPQGSTYIASPQSVGGNQYDYLRDWGVQTDAVLNIRAENRNMHLGGVSYGADVQVGLSATTDSVFSSDGAYNRGASVFIGHKWGTVSGGYQDGAEVLMRLDASDIAAGKVGSDSNWYKSVNLEGTDGSLPFYLQSSLYSESLFRGAIYNIQGGDPLKKLYLKDDFFNSLPFRLSYYSPNFMGLKLGVSYSPYYKDGLFELNSSNSNAPIRSAVAKQRNYPKIADYTKYSVQTGPLELTGSGATDAKAGVAVAGITVDIPELAVKAGNTDAKTGVAVAGTTVDIPELAVDLSSVTVAGDKAVEMYSAEDVKKVVMGGQDVVSSIDADLITLTEHVAEIDEALGLAPTAAAYTNFVGPKYENIFSGGISYEYDARDFKFKLSATAETGTAAAVSDLRPALYTGYTLFNDLLAFNLGAKVEYKGFKAVASYANLDKSGVILGNYAWSDTSRSYVANSNNGDLPQEPTYYWTLGAGYEYREAYFSATYFYSDKNDGNVLKDFALGAQCDLAFGSKAQVTPYVSWHYFTTETAAALPAQSVNNEGSVILAGVKFSF